MMKYDINISVEGVHYIKVEVRCLTDQMEFSDLIPIKGLGVRSVMDRDKFKLTFTSNGFIYDYPQLFLSDVETLNNGSIDNLLIIVAQLQKYIVSYNTRT